MRIFCLALVLLSGPLSASLAAQETNAPQFDPQVLDSCMFNTQVEDHENCIGAAAEQCMQTDAGNTTVGMSQCLGDELKLWDRMLNEAYSSLLAATAKSEDADSEKRTPLLKDMQRKWIAFRDAACAFEGSQLQGGTAAGPAAVRCSLSMTAKQALRLDGYIIGVTQ